VDSDTLYTLIGYLGSALIVTSLAMRSILKLRWIGLAGAATFVVYGYLIGAWPVVWTNAVIVLIHLHFLRQVRRSGEYFKLLEVRPDSRYLGYFLDHFAEDIESAWPGFTFDPVGETETLFVLRDLVPAGLIVTRPLEAGALEVQLEYAIPGYRDFKIGRYLYDRGALVKRGYHRAVARPNGRRAVDYLTRMGFSRSEADASTWTRELA
jgi:hypothetical protein